MAARELLSDEWAICPAPHLGDTYFTCALSEAFVRKHGGRLVHVLAPQRLWNVADLFPDAPISMLDPAGVSTPFRQGRGFRPGEPFYLRPIQHAAFFESAYRGRQLPFTKAYHDLLDLPFPSFAKPSVRPSSRDSAARRLADNGFPAGRTAILFPAAYSLTTLQDSAWSQIAAGLDARGFAVATNVPPADGAAPIPGTRPLPIPVDELIPMSEIAGMVVTARSGICDVLSTARTDLRILYRCADQEWQPLVGVTMIWDLGPCGLQDRARYFRMDASEPLGLFVKRVVEEDGEHR